MPQPKKRHTKSQRNRRRMHIFLKAPSMIKCPKCGALVLPHVVCLNCGYYKGREVINVLEKMTKKEQKAKQKEIKAQGKEDKRSGSLSMESLSKK